MVNRYYVQAHSPFMCTDAGKFMLAVCDEATENDIRGKIAEIFEAGIATLELFAQEQSEHTAALWGVVDLLKIAQGLNESLQ